MNLEDLAPDVQADVPGVPYFTAISHLRRAARAFCEKTHVWTVTLAPVNANPGVTSYAMAIPAESTAVRLSRVDIGDQIDVLLLDQDQADQLVASKDSGFFAWLEGDRLRINPAPVVAVPIVVQLSLKPTLASGTIPDWIGETYAETLQAGAKATLRDMADVDWKSPVDAELQRAIFKDGCSTAARQKTKGRASTRRRPATLY